MHVFKSVTKLCLFLIVIVSCIGFLMGKISSQEFLMTIATPVIVFYYGKKSDDTPSNNP